MRNKIAERHPGTIDTIKIDEISYTYDKRNRTYLEIAKYKYKDDPKILLISDIMIRPIQSKNENVLYITLDSAEVSKLIKFYRELKKPAVMNLSSVGIDYVINKDVFLSFSVSYNIIIGNKRIPSINWMSVWINGRRHKVYQGKFFRNISEIYKDKKSWTIY